MPQGGPNAPVVVAGAGAGNVAAPQAKAGTPQVPARPKAAAPARPAAKSVAPVGAPKAPKPAEDLQSLASAVQNAKDEKDATTSITALLDHIAQNTNIDIERQKTALITATVVARAHGLIPSFGDRITQAAFRLQWDEMKSPSQLLVSFKQADEKYKVQLTQTIDTINTITNNEVKSQCNALVGMITAQQSTVAAITGCLTLINNDKGTPPTDDQKTAIKSVLDGVYKTLSQSKSLGSATAAHPSHHTTEALSQLTAVYNKYKIEMPETLKQRATSQSQCRS
jgi:hypothetical protein